VAASEFLPQIESSIALMKDAGIEFEAGLSEAELAAVEARFNIQFPPDLRAFLQVALPCGQSFPNWRSDDESSLRGRLEWPEDGIAFDVEHSSIWLTPWGPPPLESAARIDAARLLVRQAPRLIPIYSHRYIPPEPPTAGNPVFSVHGTDIIIYGVDLWNYLRNEFAPREPHSLPDHAACRWIRFWTDTMEDVMG
jgi:hypothetical protein